MMPGKSMTNFLAESLTLLRTQISYALDAKNYRRADWIACAF